MRAEGNVNLDNKSGTRFAVENARQLFGFNDRCDNFGTPQLWRIKKSFKVPSASMTD
jgi:hypothetical protein